MMFSGNVTSPTSAAFTWKPPLLEEQNGVITGYIIEMTVLETNETFQVSTNKTYTLVDFLRPFRTYVFVIAARTAIGVGTFGPQLVLSTPEDGKQCIKLQQLFL